MDALENLRVALVHDWLTGMRGGEKVLEFLCRRWPEADLYTLLHKRGSVSAAIERLHIHTSVLQRLPRVHRYYRYLLPVMPWAVGWRLPECDLVVSSSHCVAKGVQAPAGVPHVCYCHTPMRYAWTLRDAYFSARGVKGWMIDGVLKRLRDWDRRTAAGVSHFIANSRAVQQRIRDCYGRDSVVIHPPVDTDYYTPGPSLTSCGARGERGAIGARDDFYLVMSALAPYKRLDLAIAACEKLGRRLIVIGSGQDDRKLRALAGPRTQFLGWQADHVVRDHLRRCRALLFPGEEDFGIVPLEAQACGTPVIAFGRGGATETIVPLDWAEPTHWPATAAPTGIWFAEQNVACLSAAVECFEKNAAAFEPSALRRHAEKYDGRRFAAELFGYLAEVAGGRARVGHAA